MLELMQVFGGAEKMLRWFEENKLLTADELSMLDADNFVQWFVDSNEQVSSSFVNVGLILVVKVSNADFVEYCENIAETPGQQYRQSWAERLFKA
jgi:hypothetical protein